MRALVQRVSEGGVYIDSEEYKREISKGIIVLLAVKQDDTFHDINFVADKCCTLRIFEDDKAKMNLSIQDVNGEVLVISQFTLYGDAKRGNRPNFTEAANPEKAEMYYKLFIERLRNNLGQEKVKTGMFGAMMKVKIINDGPVTIMLESKQG